MRRTGLLLRLEEIEEMREVTEERFERRVWTRAGEGISAIVKRVFQGLEMQWRVENISS